MKQFIAIKDFTKWFVNHCDEEVSIVRLYEEFEACLWLPIDHLETIFSPEAIKDLTSRVKVLDEIQIELELA